MSERTPKSGKKAGRTAVVTTTAPLGETEEKVLRMRHGSRVPDDMPLMQKAAGMPDVMAQLKAMEERAFRMSGRLDELRAELGVEEEARSTAKSKIIAQLSEQDPEE